MPKAKAKVKPAKADDSDDEKPINQLKKDTVPTATKAKSAVEKEKARQTRVRAKKRQEREDSAPIGQMIREAPLPKPRKRAKTTPISEKEENAKNVLRASKRASSKETAPAKKKVESFYIGEPPPSPRKAAVKTKAASITNPKMPKRVRVR